jgi:hypothetical protein
MELRVVDTFSRTFQMPSRMFHVGVREPGLVYCGTNTEYKHLLVRYKLPLRFEWKSVKQPLR